MNTPKHQAQSREAQCCIDYCETNFQVRGRAVINSYKCNQKQFLAADLWNIQNNKKQVSIGSAMSIY
jgi:hypothetical protein